MPATVKVKKSPVVEAGLFALLESGGGLGPISTLGGALLCGFELRRSRLVEVMAALAAFVVCVLLVRQLVMSWFRDDLRRTRNRL